MYEDVKREVMLIGEVACAIQEHKLNDLTIQSIRYEECSEMRYVM